jgi:hypothetical protein
VTSSMRKVPAVDLVEQRSSVRCLASRGAALLGRGTSGATTRPAVAARDALAMASGASCPGAAAVSAALARRPVQLEAVAARSCPTEGLGHTSPAVSFAADVENRAPACTACARGAIWVTRGYTNSWVIVDWPYLRISLRIYGQSTPRDIACQQASPARLCTRHSPAGAALVEPSPGPLRPAVGRVRRGPVIGSGAPLRRATRHACPVGTDATGRPGWSVVGRLSRAHPGPRR